jgi:peroxiredoxin (alkyl hydroperoxide reductase subunit C)
MSDVNQGILRIGSKAPDFIAKTTHGELRFSDYNKDSWVIFFSHPADFTPVCSTEFHEFALRHDEFKKRNTRLLGLSIDSVYSHLAWVHSIEQLFDTKVPFPVVADLDTKVAQLYGMIHPGASETVTVRAVYFIDPTMTIRAIIYYPLNVGRNLDEIVRTLDALQTATKHGVACPANWKPGDKVIVPAPVTYEGMNTRLAEEGLERKDWWLSKKNLPGG